MWACALCIYMCIGVLVYWCIRTQSLNRSMMHKGKLLH